MGVQETDVALALMEHTSLKPDSLLQVNYLVQQLFHKREL